MVIKIIARIVRAWHKWRLNQDFKIAKDKALELRYKSHKKQMVIYLGNKFVVVEKQHAKNLIRQGGFFKKGITMRDLERSAFFITD